MAAGKPYTSNSLAGNRPEPGGGLQPQMKRVSTGQDSGAGGPPSGPGPGLPAPSGQLSPSCHSSVLVGTWAGTLRRVASRSTATCSCLLALRASSEWDVSSLDAKAGWPQHFGDLLCASQPPPPDGTSLHGGQARGGPLSVTHFLS